SFAAASCTKEFVMSTKNFVVGGWQLAAGRPTAGPCPLPTLNCQPYAIRSRATRLRRTHVRIKKRLGKHRLPDPHAHHRRRRHRRLELAPRLSSLDAAARPRHVSRRRLLGLRRLSPPLLAQQLRRLARR